MKYLFIIISFLSLSAFADVNDVEWKNGDIIFHTSSSKQSYPIMWATKSGYGHVGLIEVVGNKKYVIEAISPVSRTELKTWIERGRLQRFTVYRLKGLTDEQGLNVVKAAKKYMGRPYDIYFTFKNSAIYCSELIHLAFKAIQKNVGLVQKVGELDVDNWLVRKLARDRSKAHPVCVEMNARNFSECWPHILHDELVTPEAIADDPQVEKIYWNYWFW